MERKYLEFNFNRDTVEWKEEVKKAKEINEKEGKIFELAVDVYTLISKLNRKNACVYAISLILSKLTGQEFNRPSDFVVYLYKILNYEELFDLKITLTILAVSTLDGLSELLDKLDLNIDEIK